MLNIKKKILLTASFLSISIFATDYDDAKFDNYVSDQGVNEVLAEAQFIICTLSRLGTKELAGDGAYKATVYADECEAATASATDSTAGTTAPSSATDSTSSSTAATGSADTSGKDIDIVYVNTAFTSRTVQTTKGWLINDKPWDDNSNREPKNIMYLLNEQTETASDTNKFGDFTLRYQKATFGNTEDDLPEWYTCPAETSREYQWSWCADGAGLGRALLIANDGSIKFKSELHNSPQQNVVADYLDNGDIAGVYSRSSGFMDESLRDDSCDEIAQGEDGEWDHDAWWECQPEEFRNSNVQILGIFAFGIASENKSYCTAMSALYEVDWSIYNEETDGPTLRPYTLTEAARSYLGNSNSWDTEEKCFSIDKNDATTNIWNYGVYNSDGSKYGLENQSFPIRALVDVDGKSKRAHGYASYWGVWVDDVYQPYITETTEWLRDDNNGSDDLSKYNLKSKTIEVNKREKSFLALDELDGVGFRFWVNDSYWSDEYEKLGFPKVEPYEGKIQFKSNKAVFTDYNNGNANEPLTYNLYGRYDGKNTYIADLVNAKLDKDNIRKIIKNDSSDPGKPMNLTVEFNQFPSYDYGTGWERNNYMIVILCNTPFEAPVNVDMNNWVYFEDQIETGICLKVWGMLEMSSDGSEMILASSPDEGYYVEAYDFESRNTYSINSNLWNQSGNTYDVKLTLGGVERPAGLEIKLQDLFTRFGFLGQFDEDGGDISRGLESFLDSSDEFTFIVGGQLNYYDHEGNRFRRIMGTFGVDDTPPATIFIDDVKLSETSEDTSHTFDISLSSVQTSDVSFEYTTSNLSTADENDYNIEKTGIVTIPAGSLTATIPFTIIGDSIAEGQDDEKLILALSNPTNVLLGRSEAIAYIFDDDTNRIIYDDYYGVYDSETETFKITEGVKYNPRYERLDLPAPISFTTSEWVSAMQKTYGEGEDWGYTDYRDLNVYSDDTNQDYTITKEAMGQTSSNTKEVGVSTTKWERISLDELPSALNCLRECFTASGLKTHYTDVKNQSDPDGDNSYSVGVVANASPSPYADVGPYIKETVEITTIYDAGTENEWTDVRTWEKGQHQDGIVENDLYKYVASDGILKDASGTKIESGVDWGLSRPGEKIRGARFANPDGWERQTEWGINAGMLIEDKYLQYIECDFSFDDEGKKQYNQFHPEFTKANGKLDQTRYCADKLWGNDDILVSYNVDVRLEKQFNIFNADDGSKVALSPPKTLYFRAPNDSSFGDDADKKFRLDYQGDHLGGIPGDVINIDTGESLGEYVEKWEDNYRWVQRFTIPDGSILTDAADVEYKVKALAGEEWLGKKDSAIGTLANLLTLKSASDLLTNKSLRWEVSQRTETEWECSLEKEFTDTYTYIDGDGNEQTDTNTYTGTDWDACYAIDEDSPEWAEVWTLKNTWNSCQERVDYWFDERQEQINIDIANSGGIQNYGGPLSPYDDEGWMEWWQREQDRCKAIGTVPTTLINGGNASVVNGTVVFDPTPNK